MWIRLWKSGSIECSPVDDGKLDQAWTLHESAAPTADMAVLPGVLGTQILRRTIQVRLGVESLRVPGGKPIFAVSRHQFVKCPS
jgi:hypothetical protein